MPMQIEHEGKQITVYTQEDLDKEVAGLKVTNQQLKTEKQEALDKINEAKEAARQAAEEKAKAEGDHAKVLELQQQKHAEAVEKFNNAMNVIKTEKITNTVNELVTKYGAGGDKSTDLHTLLKSRYTFDYDNESGAVSVSGEGVSSVEDLHNVITKSGRYDAYITGSKANGGGSPANGGTGGAGGKQGKVDGTKQERAEYFANKFDLNK